MSVALVGWILFALAVVAAGSVALSLARSLRPGVFGLSTVEARVYGTYLEALLSTVKWRPERNAVLQQVARFVEPAPGSVRLPVQLGMWVFERLPLLVGVSWRSFSQLPVAARQAVIERTSQNPSLLINALWEPTHTMLLACVVAQPAALRQCRVDRVGWVARCRAARDRELAHQEVAR